MNEILWSPNAEDAYLAILETTYFFSSAAALDLDERTEHLLERLRSHRYLCPPAPSLPGVRKCVITKNVSLVYESIGTTIEILMVVDNRMEHLI